MKDGGWGMKEQTLWPSLFFSKVALLGRLCFVFDEAG